MAKNVLTYNLAQPLDGVTNVKVNISTDDGNLAIDRFTGGEPVLARGALQYTEKQGVPTRSMDLRNGQATFTLSSRGAGQPWFRFPWQACNQATEWQVSLNPSVSLDITAHSGGGNVRLNLAGMAITRLSADTGGGNMDLVLPEQVASLSVAAKSGAGNVTVRVPGGIAARIQAETGLGKIIMDPWFSKINKDTYQSPNYEGAADKVEITLKSGAGNVSVTTA